MNSLNRFLPRCLICIALLLHSTWLFSQTKLKAQSLYSYFENYTNETYSNAAKVKVENLLVDEEAKTVSIYLSEAFQQQPFTPTLVKDVYENVKQLLPAPYDTYQHIVYALGTPIEELVTGDVAGYRDSLRTYLGREHKGNAWVLPTSLPYSIKQGLQGRHLCIWQSHGRYYNNDKRLWEWQRPHLYGTTEDLFTQTFLIPYLYPMLEKAGAVVYTPRERDWQKNEVIVDNDFSPQGCLYEEQNGKFLWEDAGAGFAHRQQWYVDGENPFTHGTVRSTEAIDGKRQNNTIRWQPDIPAEGDYAVYVSYKTLPNSVSDAHYTVRHQGINTEFRVNQQMGGSTWVYLGTFHFDKGCTYNNCVLLDNQSDHRGIVTADAVRFGGGISNIARCDSTMESAIPSGLPRSLESSRYSAQWYGFPYEIYHPRENDYDDDIVVRSGVLNYLARGSMYHPGDSGLCVPLELSMGVHSDAGYRLDNTLIGTLGIYTTGFFDNKTAAGLSRLTSRDLADIIMTQMTDDLTRTYGTWNRRAMYDRNYGETREPQVPAMILELLSHQNWADMRLGHDPHFKFTVARAIYKGILRYLSYVHDLKNPVTQPLPVQHLSALLEKEQERVRISWQPTVDVLDETAEPSHYVIYTAVGDKGFDNGTLVDARNTSYVFEVQPNTLYRFRVSAVNAGGASDLSDEVCAYLSSASRADMLIIDRFQRIAGPLPFDNDSTGGFDFNTDPGVIDNRTMGYAGAQLNFVKANYGKYDEHSFGFCGSEWEGKLLVGNTHDFSTAHARDIIATGLSLNISSCTGDAHQHVVLSNYRLIDLVMGAQKDDGYSLTRRKAFSPTLCSQLTDFTKHGGRLLVSGSFIGSDMLNEQERQFTSDVLKFTFAATASTDSITQIQGMNSHASLFSQPNEQHYWIRSADVLQAVNDGFSPMAYHPTNYSAAVAYRSDSYRTLSFGFPLECITNSDVRQTIFAATINFLLE